MCMRFIRALPGEDVHMALLLLSNALENLGLIALACDVAEAAALTATSEVRTASAFPLQPSILVSLVFSQHAQCISPPFASLRTSFTTLKS